MLFEPIRHETLRPVACPDLTLKALKLGKMLKHEYVPDFQSALHAPKPL